ncbi:hypothetical protein HPB48_006341 [Haemaphysalis longicornis]|uniref:Peptidase S1 domain-containing protein n=1 Tax=Haemaphysalis longicornis TaxID=44386 RepID=A0A9J6GUT1_HAELO|nr:hypothetical protein HPB48_006341 [Haemaphysalis longicornis]
MHVSEEASDIPPPASAGHQDPAGRVGREQGRRVLRARGEAGGAGGSSTRVLPGKLNNDLALVRLDSPVDLNLPHIGAACLPEPRESFEGHRCWVTGWGKDAFGEPPPLPSPLCAPGSGPLRPQDIKIRLGEWDVNRDDEFYAHVEKQAAQVVIHPEFFPGNLNNDLALVRLDSPVDLNLPHIGAACLPEPRESFEGHRCWVTGWGKDAFGNQGEYQNILKKVDVPVVSHDDCQERLKRTRLGPYYQLHPGFVCAGGEPGKDACTSALKAVLGIPVTNPLLQVSTLDIRCGLLRPPLRTGVTVVRALVQMEAPLKGGHTYYPPARQPVDSEREGRTGLLRGRVAGEVCLGSGWTASAVVGWIHISRDRLNGETPAEKPGDVSLRI